MSRGREGSGHGPLAGRRVAVTRARAQAGELASALEELGAEVVYCPTIRVEAPSDPEPLRRAVREAERFDWMVFTSANGVRRFWEELRAAGAALPGHVSLCAIGPATAAALASEGAVARLVPTEFVAEAVVAALAGTSELRGSRILLPRAEVARSLLPDSLRALGAEVTDVPAYRSVPDGVGADLLRARLQRGDIDVITFTAGSTVRNFVEQLGTAIGGARVACIGPITARTARELGLPVHIEAERYTVAGLVDAVVDYFGGGAR